MKKSIQLWSLVALFMMSALSLQAAVSYKVVYNAVAARYEVYMNSDVAYSGAQARISSAQVSILVPHSPTFAVTNVVGGNGNGGSATPMAWTISQANAPTENPNKDYVFFNYTAASNPSVLFTIPANTDILLFSFQNSGTCAGAITLIENATSATPDPFLPPNSRSLNTPNAMTILGGGNVNAYAANMGGGATCAVVNACGANAGVLSY